jgi:two-component system heavy metal sensor histidine kinase CusS
LAIVAAIARMHGGATFVRSAAGTTSVGLAMCGCSQMEVAPHDR